MDFYCDQQSSSDKPLRVQSVLCSEIYVLMFPQVLLSIMSALKYAMIKNTTFDLYNFKSKLFSEA